MRQKKPLSLSLLLSLCLIFTQSFTLVCGILNKQYCISDEDCNSPVTLSFCVERQCKCLQGRETYLRGVPLLLNMEWSSGQGKCVARPGSPCTFQGRWYPTDTAKLECSPGFECVPPNGRGQVPYQNQNGYLPNQNQQLTSEDFGICWNWADRDRQGPSGAYQPQSQSPFYPILTPGQGGQIQQNLPPNHQYATHRDRYPESPHRESSAGTLRFMEGIVISVICSIALYKVIFSLD